MASVITLPFQLTAPPAEWSKPSAQGKISGKPGSAQMRLGSRLTVVLFDLPFQPLSSEPCTPPDLRISPPLDDSSSTGLSNRMTRQLTSTERLRLIRPRRSKVRSCTLVWERRRRIRRS